MKKIFALFLILIILTLVSCDAKQMREYYSDKDNYVVATGTVKHIKYHNGALYLGFSNLEPHMSDNSFKIVGENLVTVQNNGIDNKLKMGDHIEFVTAPEYFGDGYVMPIVEITVNGEKLLDFEEGFVNLNKWLEEE
jgi:hypothetical protein